MIKNNKLTWIIGLFLMTSLFVTFIGCSTDDEDEDDEWVQGADFEGMPRSGAVGFTIGEYSYLCTGYGTNSNRFTDTWRFNPANETWIRVADFPGSARNNAVSFVLNGKAYVGLGTNSTVVYKDFYQYDPTTDVWTQVTDFPGEARYAAVAFALGSKGFVGTGRDLNSQDYNDFYSYTAGADGGSWEKTTSTPNKRSFSFVFILNDLAYLGGGSTNNQNLSSFYTFDGNNWVAKEPLSDRDDDDYTYNLTRLSPAAFVIDGTAFISVGLGNSSGSAISTTWRYVAGGDYWEDHQSFYGSARHQAVNFVHNGKAYVLTGRSGTSPFYDMWKFSPNPW